MRLGVNIDHVATLRQQRQEGFPSVVRAALAAQSAGADSIVAHLREDRRHMQDGDLFDLKKALRIPLAMEMAATDEMVQIARRLRPARVCLVPEKRKELTTEGGLNVAAAERRLKPKINLLQKQKIAVSLFIDPDLKQVDAAVRLKVEMVEFHTGTYARVRGVERSMELKKLAAASLRAQAAGIELHAGHGLDLENVRPIARIAAMQELNIGFSIVSDALFVGLGPAVHAMKRKIQV